MPQKTKVPQRTGKQAMRIADLLRADIVSGRFKPGKALRQEQLAERFETSRMPVRDALRILERSGFVDIQPNRGAQVAPISLLDVREIYEMRTTAETMALGFAIENMTNRGLTEAASIAEASRAGDIAVFGETNKAFHMALYAPCERPRLLAHISALNDAADRYLRISAVEFDYVERSHLEHEVILDACWKRDTASATELLRAHIETAGARLVRELTERGW